MYNILDLKLINIWYQQTAYIHLGMRYEKNSLYIGKLYGNFNPKSDNLITG